MMGRRRSDGLKEHCRGRTLSDSSSSDVRQLSAPVVEVDLVSSILWILLRQAICFRMLILSLGKYLLIKRFKIFD